MTIVEQQKGTMVLPKLDGVEIRPGIWLVGEPTPVPGTNKMRCLAQVGAGLGVVELKIGFSS